MMNKQEKIKPLKTKKSIGQIMQEKMFPALMKLSNMRGLTSIRDAFGLITPLILGGSLCFLLSILVFGNYSSDTNNSASTSLIGIIAKAADGVKMDTAYNWELLGAWKIVAQVGSQIFNVAETCTVNSFAILVSFELAYVFAKTMGYKDPTMCGVMGLVAYLVSTFAFTGGNGQLFIGTSGLFPAIFVSFFAAFVFNWLLNSRIVKIKMPKGTPPMVAKGFAYLFPIILSLIIFGIINAGFWAIGNYNDISITQGQYDANTNSIVQKTILNPGEYGFTGLVYKFICWPFLSFAGGKSAGIGLGEFYQFFIGFFWFFGINGSSVLNGVFTPIWVSLITENTNAVQKAGSYSAAYNNGSLHVVTGTFLENYSQTTGWGQTGGLLLATWLFGKNKQHREVTKIAALPGVFAINEPVTFGFPIMLDPILGIAAIFVMPITTGLAFLFVGVFHWANITYIMVPWTVPPGIGALLATGLDLHAMLISLFCWLVAFVYYIPFVLIYNKWTDIQIAKGVTKTNMQILESQKDDLKDLDDIFAKQELQKNIKNKKRKNSKLLTEKQSAEVKQGNELVIIKQKVGGFKLKINGKTVAAAINIEQLKMMVEQLTNNNNNIKKIITQDADGKIINEKDVS